MYWRRWPLTLAGCSEAEDTTPPVGTMQVSLSRPKVALGSPVEVTYKFTVAPDAPNLGTRRVFVHFLDADEELMWTDDHEPPTPTAEWKPGQTDRVHAHRCSSRAIPTSAPPRSSPACTRPANNERLKLSNEDRGDRSYKVVDFELLPQTENIFVIFKDGWHPGRSRDRRRRPHRVAVDQEGRDHRLPQSEARRHARAAGR